MKAVAPARRAMLTAMVRRSLGALGIASFVACSHGGSERAPNVDAAPTLDAGPTACALPTTTPSVLVSPDAREPWAGAVAIVTTPLLAGTPLAAWAIDGDARPSPTPSRPFTVLDTRGLTDGPHRLSLTTLGAGDALERNETTFCVANGAPIAPAFRGPFVDVTAASGLDALAIDPAPKEKNTTFLGAVAADFDGDGDVDLFAWDRDGGRVYEQTGALVYRPKGATFPLVRAAGAGDLDDDGDPDVIAVGDAIAVLRNDGGTLVDVTSEAGLLAPSTGGAFRGVTLADLDLDGLLDVAVSQVRCDATKAHPSLVLRNEGALHFADVAAALGLDGRDPEGFAMAIDARDDGAIDVWAFHEGCVRGGTRHHRYVPSGDLPVEVPVAQPVFARISPMGSAWLDADGDGALDLFLAGDFVSPVLRAPELVTSLGARVGLDSYVDASSDKERASPVSAWSIALLDADLDGRVDVFVPHHPSDPTFGAQESSRDALFWQREPGAFRDASRAAGLSSPRPCRAVHAVDLDLDGDTDLLVGCLDGLRVLRNDLVDPSEGRTIVLRGTLSNADGVHARIESRFGERRLVRGGGQPYAGGVVRETMRASSGPIVVTWPSGLTQTVDAGTTPVVNVREPIAVSLSARRVPAGSSTPVAIAIDAAGQDVAATASAGTWSSPLAKDAGGVWRGTLVPPIATSTVVLELRVAGKALLVRPRIFVR